MKQVGFPRKIIFFLVIVISLFPLGLANVTRKVDKGSEKHQQVVSSIIDYIHERFPSGFSVGRKYIDQLAWVQDAVIHTYEYGPLYKNERFHVEVPRALNRLYCLELLKAGTQEAYRKFITPQLENENSAPPLSYLGFKELSNQIQQLGNIGYETLKVSVIVQSLHVAPQAREAAYIVQKDRNIPSDGTEFLSATINYSWETYPLVVSLIQEYPDAEKWLKAAFSPRMHFRHMMYTEGGVGMFKTLRDKIQHGLFSKSELNFWYCHWMLNIAGFRGHIAQNGSLYLTEHTFMSMKEVKKNLDQMFNEPNYNPLEPYLKFRANLIGLDVKDKNDFTPKLVAHLASMLRIFDKEAGQKLLNGVNRFTTQQKENMEAQMKLSLNEYEEPTPVYAPALFANALLLTSNGIETTIEKILPIYIKALMMYRNLRKTSKIDADTPLNFNGLAAEKNLRLLLASDPEEVHIKVSEDGMVTIAPVFDEINHLNNDH